MKKFIPFNSSTKKFIFLISVFVLTLIYIPQSFAWALLENIKVTPLKIDISKEESTQLSWHQSHESLVDVFIAGMDGKIVKKLVSKEKKPAGTYQVHWNGKNEQRQNCPSGVYIPIVKVRTLYKGAKVYNPSSQPWGQAIKGKSVFYDKDNGKVHYSIENYALCRLMAGEKNGGPLHKIFFNWKPLAPGNYELDWDGLDVNQIIKVAEQDAFSLVLDGFTLPENAIIVSGSDLNSFPDNGTDDTVAIRSPNGNKKSYNAVIHKWGQSSDSQIQTSFSKNMRASTIVPKLKGIHKLKFPNSYEITPAIQVEDRYEAYLFVDGKFISDTSHDNIPLQLELDTNKYRNGEHIITINILTAKDEMMAFSKKVIVNN